VSSWVVSRADRTIVLRTYIDGMLMIVDQKTYFLVFVQEIVLIPRSFNRVFLS